jgi:putative membrane protein
LEEHDMPGYWGGGFGLWWIFPLVFGGLWLAVIGLVIWRCRGWWKGGRGGAPDAMTVLRERFARGEIDTDEYQRRLRVLQGQ